MPAIAAFVAGAAVSLATSWLLVSRLERIGERLGLSEALLGIVAALAADAPEISAAVSALASHQQRVGAGVVLGSNVFNLAALLGLGAVVAGRIGLHRKVVALGGAVAVSVALVCAAVVAGLMSAAVGLALAVAVLGVYLLVLGTEGRGLQRLRLPPRWQAWLRSAVTEEEIELEDAIRPSRGRWPDVVIAVATLVVVVAASVTMERAAISVGTRYGVPQIITGGLVLAAVTSLPNAVAAVYLAGRGRGAATLSTALNSNTLNVVAGFLLPGALIGLGARSGQAGLVTAWYAGLSLAVLALAYRHRGLSRRIGAAVIAAYAAFTASVIISGHAGGGGTAPITGLAILSALVLAAALPRSARARRDSDHPSEPTHGGDARRDTDRPPDVSANGHHKVNDHPTPCGPAPAISAHIAGARARDVSLLAGWPAGRILALSIALPALVAAIDAAAGHRLILIGLLIAGPCIALLTGRWPLTVLAGAWACGLAVLLGVPDGIWATGTHLVFVAAVAAVTVAATAAAAVISHARSWRNRL